MKQNRKLNAYYLVSITGLVLALVGFTYNAWRLEISEDNSNIRTAAFSILTELAELEQVVYALHYDHDPVAGNPRHGWVKVGLVVDLSMLVDAKVSARAEDLRQVWSGRWAALEQDREAVDAVIAAVDATRAELKRTLAELK